MYWQAIKKSHALATAVTLVLTLCIMLALDAIYLGINRSFLLTQIAEVQRVALQFRPIGAVLCYLFLVLGLYYFILVPNRPLIDAFLLGIMVYGVYETTNYASLKRWRASLVAMDTLWGGVLLGATTGFVRRIMSI